MVNAGEGESTEKCVVSYRALSRVWRTYNSISKWRMRDNGVRMCRRHNAIRGRLLAYLVSLSSRKINWPADGDVDPDSISP